MYPEATRISKEKVRKLDDLQLGKTEEMLLGKLIDFKSLWSYNTIEVRNELYQLFFDWNKLDKDIKAGAQSKTGQSGSTTGGSGEKNNDRQKDAGGENGESGAEGQTQGLDAEERKKRQQLRMDQELQDFDDRGGFAQVLKDIFNPTD